MKYQLYIGWIFFVVLAATLKYLFGSTKTTPEWSWQASHNLQPFHQLIKTDLTIPDSVAAPDKENTLKLLIGRHLLTGKKKGESIRPSDVSAWPKVTTRSKNYVIGLVGLRKDELPLMILIQQGTWITVCSTGQPEKNIVGKCSDSLQVVATHNPIDSTDNAFWLVQLASSRSSEISHFNADRNRYILIR